MGDKRTLLLSEISSSLCVDVTFQSIFLSAMFFLQKKFHLCSEVPTGFPPFVTALHLITNLRARTHIFTSLVLSGFSRDSGCLCELEFALSVSSSLSLCVHDGVCVCVRVFEQSFVFACAGTLKHLCLPSQQRGRD